MSGSLESISGVAGPLPSAFTRQMFTSYKRLENAKCLALRDTVTQDASMIGEVRRLMRLPYGAIHQSGLIEESRFEENSRLPSGANENEPIIRLLKVRRWGWPSETGTS